MQYGEKIAELRKKSGMTQSELGSALNVTFQAVSKWERGESLPDFETMSRMAKLFGVPLSYFEDEINGASAAEEANAEPVAEPQKELVGVCHDCGKAVYEGEAGQKTPYILCSACVAKRKQAVEQAKKKALAEARQEKIECARERNRGLIWAAVIVGILYAISIGVSISNGMYMNILYASISTIFLYTFVAQLFWDGFIVDTVLFGGKIIGTPGIIFEFDWDGFIFLIGMKLLFAILRMIVWLVTFLLAAIFAILISPFTFAPALIRVTRGD